MTRFIPKRKLRAATATRRMPQRAAIEEFDQEPNMSFVKALAVVVVLHIVAVGGIYAFNSIKAHKNAYQPVVASPTPAVAQRPIVADAPQAVATPAPKPIVVAHEETNTKVVVKPTPDVKPSATPHKAATEAASAAVTTSSVTVYTVVKGDNPVSIARKLHVSYDELLKLNNIEDPKKLRIGQKLKIPAKKIKKPTADD